MLPEWLSYQWFLPETFKSFIWANPYYLYAILAVPFIYLLRGLTINRNREKLFLSTETDGVNAIFYWLRYLIPLFFGLGLVFGIIALARPQRVLSVEEEIAEGIDIVLAIDISESMMTADLEPNRLEVAKSVARSFIAKRENDRIGLVAFSGQALTLCPLTTDHAILDDHLQKLSAGLIQSQGTAIGNAIATCINRLRDSKGNSKVIILLSDGDNTAGTIGPETATELAKAFQIRIYSIALGRQNAQELDTRTLNEIAEESKGSFFRAISEGSLAGVFGEIDLLEKQKFENIALRDVTDYYYIYLNWAVVFFLISFLLKNTALGNLLED